MLNTRKKNKIVK